MTPLNLLLIKASLSMMMLYVLYWFFFRSETLFRISRYYLLFSLIISILLPLISIRYTVELSSDISSGSPNLSIFTRDNGREDLYGMFGATGVIALVLYFSGAAAFLFRLLWQLTILFSLIIINGNRVSDGLFIVENNRYSVPFSFLNYVFINPQHISTDELDNIIAHEKVHIRERHWLDLLIVEFLTIILWFNPFVWLFERSIKQNHEYLADEGVIAQGYSVGRYHSVLINQLMGMEVIGLTNNLNYSLNAKRLKMMKKEKTPKQRAYKLIWALPVITILLAAFSEPQYTYAEPTKKDVTSEFASFAKDITVAVKLQDKNGDAIPGANVTVKGTKKGAVTDKNGYAELTINESDVVLISSVGFQDIVLESKVITAKGTEKDGVFNLAITMMAKTESNGEVTELEEMEKDFKLKSQTLQEEITVLKSKYAELEAAVKEGKISEDEMNNKRKSLDAKKKELSAKQLEVDNTLKKIAIKKAAEKAGEKEKK
ncbi:MAG TPA: M56 family metallopeptidase [Bacteroidales bacterium]|nr:M56 family metallopeptidase [Bacteroidales bacterium]